LLRSILPQPSPIANLGCEVGLMILV
jgi:hypothetical protein